MNDLKIETLFQSGLRAFENGEYYEAHEVWEEIWSEHYVHDRDFIQGLIQLSVSFVHLGNGNLKGAKSLIKKCMKKFEQFNGVQRGINMGNLKNAIEVIGLVYSDISKANEFDWDLVPVLGCEK